MPRQEGISLVLTAAHAAQAHPLWDRTAVWSPVREGYACQYRAAKPHWGAHLVTLDPRER